MLDGIEVIEGGDCSPGVFADATRFVDSEPLVLVTEPADSSSVAQQNLQLIRRELFEIRELLGSGY
jgi:hypothetical protein